MRDELFREPLSMAAGFEFNADVVRVFDDMLSRSIPFYGDVQAMTVDFVRHFYTRDTNIYDLGCSTGLMMAALLENLPGIHRIIGVDNSEPMIKEARERLEALSSDTEFTLKCEDLRRTTVENASAVIMHYTLQFVRPLYRPQVVKHIFDGLQPGGILVLSEKVLVDSQPINQLFIDMYYQFKRRKGYTESEISRKRERLENVLVPYKISEQKELLRDAGFKHVEVFFQWHNFASFIAIKQP